MAADLPYKAAVKARPPANDDLCWKGVCVYGNFDMGVTYQNHGAPLSPLAVGPLELSGVEERRLGSYFGAGPNQISTSFIGLRGKQEIARQSLRRVQLADPVQSGQSGMNANGIGSVSRRTTDCATRSAELVRRFVEGRPDVQQRRLFGLSSPIYGTFTMGRQSALSSDLVINYDPLSGSNAWSVLTFQGANGGGGDTEDRIYDNSFEYRVNVGPVRLAAETQLATAATAAPATPSKAISASTIWASRWTSSAARSMTRFPRHLCARRKSRVGATATAGSGRVLWLRRSPTTPCSRSAPATRSGRGSFRWL